MARGTKTQRIVRVFSRTCEKGIFVKKRELRELREPIGFTHWEKVPAAVPDLSTVAGTARNSGTAHSHTLETVSTTVPDLPVVVGTAVGFR